jgi:argininosuccinate lyase
MSGEPPEGYLGAEARIRGGPAPELVEAGYALELGDAPLLHRGMGLADLAHVLVLGERGVIPPGDGRELLRALVELLTADVADIVSDPRYGDLANARERVLEQRIGTAAGWLNAGRTRREGGRIAFRLALRERVLELASAVVRYAGALVELAARERDTLMPDYTYLQAAQPTTAGHWVLSFAYPALRDAERLHGDLAWVNRSPGGAGGVNGSRFPLDRERIADLLGFSAPVTHTRDGMWQTDGLADLTSHAAIAATGASRFAEDLELYASDEFGLLRIGDELCRASALMPQKRNPYALVVLRGGAGTLIGRATGILTTQRTPSGQTDNLLYAYGEVCGAVEMAARLLRLAAATAASVTVDAARAARVVRESFALATDLAEVVSVASGLDFRSAYRVVGRAVASPGKLDASALDAAAAELLGRRLELAEGVLADAIDPARALATRTVPGGAAPQPMDAMIGECRGAVADAGRWIDAERTAISAAEDELVALARTRAGS